MHVDPEEAPALTGSRVGMIVKEDFGDSLRTHPEPGVRLHHLHTRLPDLQAGGVGRVGRVPDAGQPLLKGIGQAHHQNQDAGAADEHRFQGGKPQPGGHQQAGQTGDPDTSGQGQEQGHTQEADGQRPERPALGSGEEQVAEHGQEHQHQAPAQGHPMAHEAGQPAVDTSQGRRHVLSQRKTGRHQASGEKRLEGQTRPGSGEIIGHQQDDGKQPELVNGRQADFGFRGDCPGRQCGPDKEQQGQLDGREMEALAAIQEAVQQEAQNGQPQEDLRYRNADHRKGDCQGRQSEDDGVKTALEPMHAGGNGHSGDPRDYRNWGFSVIPAAYLRATTTCRSKPQPVTSSPWSR